MTVYLSLGSNLGDRADYLKKAIQLLGDSNEIELVQQSKVYETEPWFKKDDLQATDDRQQTFLNQVIEIKTALGPLELLRLTQKIERSLGRQSKGDLSPRTIDIDILLYDKESIESDELTIPHPRMKDRKFVLIPLLEIAPQLSCADDLIKCKDNTRIKAYLAQ